MLNFSVMLRWIRKGSINFLFVYQEKVLRSGRLKLLHVFRVCVIQKGSSTSFFFFFFGSVTLDLERLH